MLVYYAATFILSLDFPPVVVLTGPGAMSSGSSDSDRESSLHADEEESDLEEDEKLEDESVAEPSIEELEHETVEEEEQLQVVKVTNPNIQAPEEPADVVMERELSIVAVPPKLVLHEENNLEVSSSPAFQILDTVSI